MGPAWEDHGLVFPNVWGRYMPPTTSSARSSAGPWRGPNFLECAFTTYATRSPRFSSVQLNGKQPLKIVSEMMGHKRVPITQDLYTYLGAQIQRGAAAALDDLLGPEPAQPRDSSAAGA